MRFRIGRILLPVFFFIFLGANHLTFAEGLKSQVLILDIPRFSFDDLGDGTPWLRRLVEEGAVGIMTTPLADPLTLEKVYLAFNSGTQLKTTEESVRFYDVDEEYQGVKAGVLYGSLTGFRIPPEGIVNLGFPRLTLLNDDRAGVSNIGLMGRILHQQGIKTAVIGNADADLPNRDSALLVMDESGMVDYGNVGRETLIEDPDFPFGMRTDTEKIYKNWVSLRSQASVIVIALGDLERIERFNVYLNPDLKKAYRQEVLRNYDRFIGKIMTEDLKDTFVMIFSGLPPVTLKNNNAKGLRITPGRLTPIIIRGPGFIPGVLISASTRRSGIVTCYDLPATIFRFLNITQSEYPNRHSLSSRPIKPVKTSGGNRGKSLSGGKSSLGWEQAAGQADFLGQNFNIRWPLLTVYGYLLIGLILIGIIGLIYNMKSRHFRILTYSFLFFLTIPAVFILEALFNPVTWSGVILWTLGLAGLLLGMALYLSKQNLFKALSFISLFTAGLIAADGIFNGFLEIYSFLGYSAVAGARFYGIGNEYMGFLLGALIVFLSLNLEKINRAREFRYRKPVLWIIVCGVAVFLAHPNLGANIGGGITAIVGLGVTTYLWLERPIKLREVLVLGLGLVLLLTFIGAWELWVSGHNVTHFGQLLNLVRENGPKELGDLIGRKLEMNVRLINYTPWTKVLIGILLLVPFVYQKPPAKIDQLKVKYPYLIHGFFGLTLTALVALLVNDSGIVSVATMFIFGFGILFLILYQEKGSPEKGV